MATKFADFISEKKIDTRRLLAVSRRLERLRREDRMVKLKQRLARKSEGGGEEGNAEKPERRSGRPVTPRLITAALEGKPVSGPAKTRLLRAVNHVLEQKKEEPVELRKLF